MSRIDEALTRAAGRRLTDRRDAPADRNSGRPDPFALAEYPVEPKPAVRAVPVDTQTRARVPAADSPRQQPPPRLVELPNGVVRVGSDKLVISDKAAPVWIDHYRMLAQALLDIRSRSTWGGAFADRTLKTLLVASALPGDGRTLTAVNLALTLSVFHHCRVLLIDADLRRPSVHKLLELPNTTGLCDVLESSAPPVLHAFSPMLTVLPAGRPSAEAMRQLSTERLRGVFESCAPPFDWVLLDMPPVTRFAHADRLARLARAALFVINSGSTSYPVVHRAMTALGHGCIVGTVLNRTPTRPGSTLA